MVAAAHGYGLLRGTFRPADAVCTLCSLSRQPTMFRQPLPIQINNHRRAVAVVIVKAKQLPAIYWEAPNSHLFIHISLVSG